MASPFDQRLPPGAAPPGQPPPSFKTNVNRMKTKKWIEANKYSYDGDDWGEYDEEDEYGVEEYEQPPSSAHPPAGYGPVAHPAGGPSSNGRSFTNPTIVPVQGVQRQQSFEVGDERRAFSAGARQPPPPNFPPSGRPAQLPDIPQGQPLHVQTDVASSLRHNDPPSSDYGSRHPSVGGASNTSDAPSSADPTHRRDFSPSAMPLPLSARSPVAVGPQSATETPTFPPALPLGRSSPGQSNSPQTASPKLSAVDETPRQRSGSNPAKPLPFIRPADIYKRMDEERARERASQESSRPSLDSLLRPGEDARSTSLRERSSSDSLPSTQDDFRTGTPASQKKPTLPTVSERRSEYYPADPLEQEAVPRSDQTGAIFGTSGQPAPQESRAPGFVNESEHFAQQSTAPDANDALHHQGSFGFRSVVHQAFDRPDGDKSVPDTPASASKQSSVQNSEVSRSNTDSTAGISPIMSRVPSVGTTAATHGNYSQMSSIDHSLTPAIAEEPAENALHGTHSREQSAESANFIPGYRRDRDTPPSRGSPARTPDVETGGVGHRPHSGQYSNHAVNPAVRESDLAQTVQSRPGTIEASRATEAVMAAPQAYLDQRHVAPPNTADFRRAESSTKSRSQSPSKSRVQQLAGDYGDMGPSDPRRNSLHSVDSWERDDEHLNVVGRPPLQSEQSFQPRLPGQWESFPVTPAPMTAEDSAATRDIGNTYVDLAPTTEKHQLSSQVPASNSHNLTSNPMAALTAAGAAMGEAFKASVGLDKSEDGADSARDEPHTDRNRRASGDIYGRPAALRLQSNLSDASSVPPTPPPKDTHLASQPQATTVVGAVPPQVPSKAEVAPVSTGSPLTQSHHVRGTSADTKLDMHEIDNFRRDVAPSLSAGESQQESATQSAHDDSYRESEILPAEYGDYWSGSGPDGSRYSQLLSKAEVGPQGVEITRPLSIEKKDAISSTEASQRPGFLTKRFSWEQSQDSTSFGKLASGSTTEAIDHAQPPQDAQQASDAGGAMPTAPAIVEPEDHVTSEGLKTPVRGSTEASRPITPEPGLHVVNLRGAEEAVDFPPRLITPEPSIKDRNSLETSTVHRLSDDSATKDLSDRELPAIVEPEAASSPLAPPAEISDANTTPSKPRLSPFRELAAIPSSAERIKAYNVTREQFATTDTGLQGWLAQTIAAHPEHSHLLSDHSFPVTTSVTRIPHKTNPSFSKLSTMITTASNTISPQQSQQAVSSPSQQGLPSAGDGGMGAKKGKELLQNAGALGGKVGQGAKGLLAKGRSKLRSSTGGEKVTPIATTSASPSPQSLARTLSRDATPTKRHMSPFRRFSRPSSVAYSEVESIPEIPDEPLPRLSRHQTPDDKSEGSATSAARRRMSPFRRRSRPTSVIDPDGTANVPEVPKEPMPAHQRSATFGGRIAREKSDDGEDTRKLTAEVASC